MIFAPTSIDGVWLIEPERLEDERGFFARTWDAREARSRGLATAFVQSSVSYNRVRGTLRGMHYQAHPHEEAKLVRCTAGEIFDVAVDLRPESATFGGWFGSNLSADNRVAMYIPEGCAHGFLTLSDGVEILYDISAHYKPKAGCGVRFDDPAFGIEWPGRVAVINERDRTYPDFVAVG